MTDELSKAGLLRASSLNTRRGLLRRSTQTNSRILSGDNAARKLSRRLGAAQLYLSRRALRYGQVVVKEKDADMSKLVETDVDKAGKGMMPRGGSSRMVRRTKQLAGRALKTYREGAATGSRKQLSRIARAQEILGKRHANNWASAMPIRGTSRYLVRRGVYKSIDALDTQIEKARGLLLPGKARFGVRASEASARTASRLSARAKRSFANLRGDAKAGRSNSYTREIAAGGYLRNRIRRNAKRFGVSGGDR